MQGESPLSALGWIYLLIADVLFFLLKAGQTGLLFFLLCFFSGVIDTVGEAPDESVRVMKRGEEKVKGNR